MDTVLATVLTFVSDLASVSFERENCRLLFTLNFNEIQGRWIGDRQEKIVKVDLL